MKNTIRTISVCFLAILLVHGTQAQSPDAVKTQMIKDWERAKAYTTEYLNAMPSDKYSFKATDSIRSFAQQMLHLASGNIFLMMQAWGDKPPAGFSPTLEHRTTAQTKDSVMYFVTASYDYAINLVKNSDVSKWFEAKKMFNKYDETKFSLMAKAFEHQTHHRGQTTIYIRLVGVKPPDEKLF